MEFPDWENININVTNVTTVTQHKKVFTDLSEDCVIKVNKLKHLAFPAGNTTTLVNNVTAKLP